MKGSLKCLSMLGLSVVSVSAFAQGRLIAVDSSRALYEINMTTGAKTSIGTVSSNASTTSELAYDRVNDVIYVASSGNDSLFTLDLATGNATLVGAFGDSTVVMHGLEFGPGNVLYAVSGASANQNVYTVDTTTGVATAIGATGLTSFNNLGYNSDTGVMYMTNSGSDSLYTMNLTNGAPTLVGPLNGSTNPNGVAYNYDNGLMYMVDNSTDNLYTLNLATGAANLIGSTGTGNLLGLMYYNPVPEPASMAALGLGAAALLRRRRR